MTTEAVATLSEVSEYPGPNDRDGGGALGEAHESARTKLTITIRGGAPKHTIVQDIMSAQAGVDPKEFLDAVTDVSSAAISDAMTQAVDLYQGSFKEAWTAQRRAGHHKEERALSLRDLAGFTRTSTSIWEAEMLVLPFSAPNTAPEAAAKPQPSERVQLMMQRARDAARREVQGHLDAGFEVTGRRRGTPVVIKPKK